MRPGPILAAAVGAAVAAAIAAGVAVTGPPAEVRQQRLDARRVDDLALLARDIDLFVERHGRLPTTLADLGAEPGIGPRRIDPETGADYEYRPIEDRRYELCATFATASAEPALGIASARYWAHAAGRQCFALTAEPVSRAGH